MMTGQLTCCPFCGNDRIGSYWSHVNFWRCSNCKLIFRNPMPSGEEVERLYDESWKQPETYTSETGGTTLELARVYARKLAKSLGIADFRGLKLLDFGAGRGSMLQALSELGADISAVEPFGYEFLRELGFQVYRSLEEIPVKEAFDGIVTVDVVEHLPKPWETLRAINAILKENGWLYVATPNADGLNAKISRGNWREAKKKGHLVFFAPQSMETVLRKCGFASCRCLRWAIRYSANPLKIAIHYLLQIGGWDGELRYLAWKA